MSLKIFISYAHQDRALYEEFSKHLQVLKREDLISSWADSDIAPGAEKIPQIMEWLGLADIILLLISPDFISSDFCYSVMERALQRHESKEARVIPILLCPVDWQPPLADLQCLPRNAKFVVRWSSRDEAFRAITQDLRNVVKELSGTDEVSETHVRYTTAVTIEQKDQIWSIPFRRNPFFTGRESVLKRLRDVLSVEQTAAVVQPTAISGLGGIGKTQVAIEYAYQYRHHYQYVLWAQGDTSANFFTSALMLANQLHLPIGSGENQDIVISAVKHWLETHRSWLLILDNANDLATIDEIFPQNDAGHILITTRESATGYVAQTIVVEKMSDEEALLLLLRRAKYRGRDDLSDSERTAALAIVQEMDGLPLAIDQAGAYIEETGCNLSRYLELFHTYKADLLKRRGGDYRKNHHESVATTFSLAFAEVRKMNPIAADLLKFCVFLAPSFIPVRLFEYPINKGERQVPAFIGNPLLFEEAVATLRRFSLIARDSEQEHLEVHALVQAVLRYEMDELEQRQWAELVICCLSKQLLTRKNTITSLLYYDIILHVITVVWNTSEWNITLPEIVPLLFAKGTILRLIADFVQAVSDLERGLAICEQELGEVHPFTVQILENLATAFKRWGDYDKAKHMYERAIKASKQVFGEESLETIRIGVSLAGLHKDLEEYDKAEPLYEKALAMYHVETHHGEVEDEEVGLWTTVLANVADFYLRQKKVESAEPLLRKAMEMWHKRNPHVDLLYASLMNNLACVYLQQGKSAEALELFNKALAVRKQRGGEEHPDVALSLLNLASLYIDQKRDIEAEQCYKRALEIYEKVLNSHHLSLVTVTSRLATFYAHRQRFVEAEPLFQRALVICEKVLGEEHPKTIQALISLGYLYEQQGMLGQAKALYEKGLVRSEKIWGLDHDQTKQFFDGLMRLTTEKSAGEKDIMANALTLLREVLGPDRFSLNRMQRRFLERHTRSVKR